jgi:hypothetical protein
MSTRSRVIYGVVALVAVGFVLAGLPLAGDDGDRDVNRVPDPALGAAAVSAFGYDLAVEEDVARACADLAEAPDDWPTAVADNAGPIGTIQVRPTTDDVEAWGDVVCR